MSLVSLLYRIKNDVIYLAILIFSFAIAYVFRHKKWMEYRKSADGVIGLLMCLFLLGSSTWYSLILVGFHLVLYKLETPNLGKVSFVSSFAYLALLRVIHHAGFTPLEFLINVVQLILTLRVVGLSYEIEDSIQNGGNTNEKTRFVKVPNTLEAFNYLYNFIGLFTGPYYTYQIYSDTLESTAIYDVDITEFISERVLTISWSLPSLLIVYGLAPLEFLRSEAVSSTNFIVLMFWVCIAFYYLRLRIYTAWMIAECICITSGIGVYPASCNNVPSGGPQNIEAYNKLKNKLNIKYDAVTISNLDIPNVEMSTGFRNGMRAWNRSVQYWLATFVYKRSPKSIRMPYTMFISAFWHGLHIGYFLSFMTIPLCTAAEDLIYKVVPIDKQTGERPKWFQFIWLNIRTRSFELMASGFLLLTWTDTARLWNAMYWYIHIVMISIIVGSKLIIESREKSDNDKMKVN